MNFIFFGQFVPNKILDDNFQAMKHQVSLAANNFYNAMLEGLAENGHHVCASVSLDQDILKNLGNVQTGIDIRYRKRFKMPVLNHLSECGYAIMDIWCFKRAYPRGQAAALVNILRLSRAVGAVIACRLMKIPAIGVVTDVPGYRVNSHANVSALGKLRQKLQTFLLRYYDGFVLLSEQMKEVVSVSGKPTCMVEGFWEEDGPDPATVQRESETFTVLYAGALHRAYGVMDLIQAMQSIQDDRLVLELYGTGDAQQDIENIAAVDPSIRYKKLVTRWELLKREREVSLLVNPRPVEDLCARYCFPSKNMEYLASGTPVLLTRIPSIPKEYESFVVYIEDNKVDTLAGAIRKAMEPEHFSEYLRRAAAARRFILTRKNAQNQSAIIAGLAEKLCKKEK